jgi:hypothetical protein
VVCAWAPTALSRCSIKPATPHQRAHLHVGVQGDAQPVVKGHRKHHATQHAVQHRLQPPSAHQALDVGEK